MTSLIERIKNCPGCARRRAWLKQQAERLVTGFTGHPKVPRQATLVGGQAASLDALDSHHVRTGKTRG